MYLNSTQTHGVVRLYLKSSPTAAPFCTWNFNYDAAFSSTPITPDFPHIGLTNNYLHLITNNIQNGTTWVGTSDYRLNIEDLIACGSVTLRNNFYNWKGTVGQRVYKPAPGGKEVMYFGGPESSTQFRAFKWADTAASPTTVLSSMSTSNFTDPDCRGGNNNVDLISRVTAYSNQGFTVSGAAGRMNDQRFVAFYWNVGPDATSGHSQGHIHGVALAEGTLANIGNLAIFNSGMCWSFPAVNSNDRGDLGFAAAYGGRIGGGGGTATAAVPAVGISDDISGTTPGVAPNPLYITASATDNSTRYGDYLTVRQVVPCSLAFSAATYAMSSATTPVRKYTEFYRGRDSKCWTGRANTLP